MKKKLIVISSVFLILLLSGCTDVPIVSGCSDEGLAIVDYNVNPLERIYPGYTVGITFWLENKGSYDADNVVVDFFDREGFVVEHIECEDGSSSGNTCKISKIATEENCFGEKKKVSVNLRVPEYSGQKTVSFSVNYNYHGNSKLLFSIWKRESDGQWGQKQKTSTYGPVKVDIDSEFLLKRVVDDRTETITEWVEEGQRFTMEIDVREVSSNQYESFEKKILSGDFRVNLDHVSIYGECDFPGGRPSKEIVYPTKEPLMCDMVVGDINQDWVTGSIEVDYDYNYEIVKQQEFNIE